MRQQHTNETLPDERDLSSPEDKIEEQFRIVLRDERKVKKALAAKLKDIRRRTKVLRALLQSIS